MAITRKTAAEFAADIETAIRSRNADYDTKVGPIPDLYIAPMANVLELQNERIRTVQQLLSLRNDGSFNDSDLDNLVYNESIIRLTGRKAKATLVFSRSTVPTANILIKANFPVGTLADETTGAAITFLTLQDTTLDATQAASYFNTATQRYELLVSAEATIGTSVGNVSPNRIIRPLRPLNGFDTVFNRDAATGGRDGETNDQLINRYLLSLLGSSPTVVNGVQKILRDKFPDVEDSNLVYGNNPLNIRSAADGGAVDAYIIGTTPTTVSETIVFPGAGQVIPLSSQPISVLLSAGAFTQGIDYSLVKDTTGYAGSIRASDGIIWLPTGTAPTIGSLVVVTYTYNALTNILQNAFKADDLVAPGRDLLFKEATKVNVALSANLKIRPGYNVASAVDAIVLAVTTFINELKLGQAVEASDLQLIVRAFTGVDNFVITNLSKVGTVGTSDVALDANEYARIESADLALTVI